MIAVPALLVNPAVQAGINVPSDLHNYDVDKFPHWHVYLTLQLGAPLPASNTHWENAVVVAGVPEDKIRTVTQKDLHRLGFRVGFSK